MVNLSALFTVARKEISPAASGVVRVTVRWDGEQRCKDVLAEAN